MAKKQFGRKVPNVLYIFCEGEKTEPNYINYYLDKVCGVKRRAIRVEPTKKNTPVQLVEEAISYKQSGSSSEGDCFWVVYDRESEAKYSDSLHSKALKLAEKNGIRVALSNVCFEIWVLLHFVNNTAAFTNCSNLLKDRRFKDALKTIGVDCYEKGDQNLMSALFSKVSDARARAVTMNTSSEASAPKGVVQSYKLNPYTDMHLLLNAIDEFLKN